MEKTCKVCGRLYKRQQCEYCQRQKRWDKKIGEKQLKKHFTPRQQADILKYNELKGKEKPTTKSEIFIGKTQTYKTITAARQLFTRMELDYVEGNFQKYCFVSVEELLIQIRATYGQQGELSDWKIIQEFLEYDYLVMDDICVGKVTDWVYQILYMIVNMRWEYQKITIFTSNHSLDTVSEIYKDDRITSRIEQQCGKEGIIEL